MTRPKLKVLCPDGRFCTAHRMSANTWKVMKCTAPSRTRTVSGDIDASHRGPIRFMPRGKNAWAVMPKVRA